MSLARCGSLDLYFEEHGSGDPLLLIMGLAADSRAWLMQVPDLSPHYRTIVFDNRGVGRSSKPPGPYTTAQMADDAAGLLDHLGIARAHVLGISMGGMIAQELALRHPNRVWGLVLGCTYSEPDASIESQRQLSLKHFGAIVDSAGALKLDATGIDPIKLFEHLLPLTFTRDYIDRELPKLMEIFGGALEYGFSPEAVLAQVEAVMKHNTTERLRGITAPTLVITGDADLLVPPASSDIIARHIPNARLVKIPGGSHGFNFETPGVFNREVIGFLGGVGNGKRA